MARRPDSEAIGRVPCTMPNCGQIMLVFRSKRRGNHLMARCPKCGPFQSTNPEAQEYFASGIGAADEPPQTIHQPSETVPAEPSETVTDDFDPGPDPLAQAAPRATQTPKPENSGKSLFALTIVALGFAGALLFPRS